MDFTQSDASVTHAGTGNKMHQDDQPVTTIWSADDANSLIWSLMEVVAAGGQTAQQFDPDVPASYQVFRDAILALITGGDADTVDGQHAADLLNRANHTGANHADTLGGQNLAWVRNLANALGTLAANRVQQGSGSGLDADMVDGQHAADLLNRANHTGANHADTLGGQNLAWVRNLANTLGTLAANRVQQGSGSSLDADMLDGHHASHFLNNADFQLVNDGANPNIYADSGYIIFPGIPGRRLCLQWGKRTSTTGNPETFLWPTTFAEAFTVHTQRIGAGHKYILCVAGINSNGFTIDREGGIAADKDFYFIGFGRT